LSTDCQKTQNKIIEACPAKKILTINKPFVDTVLTSLNHKDNQDHACIDLMLLAKCKSVYGTPFSTFAKTATKITDIPFTEVHSKNLYQYCNIELPPLSLTVGIKNRYEQLKVSLMSWTLQESIEEILIIDWDSNDIDYQELQQIDDRIRIVKIPNQPLYNHSQVLNTCIKYAKNNHILKMDVDYIFNPYIKLNQWLDIDWEREFMAGSWNQNTLDNKLGFIEHLNGFMCVHKKHIQNIGGYNENFTGYGWEDCELYIRLQKESGLVKIIPPISSNFVPIYHNPHMDNIRTKYQIIKDREESRISNISKTSYKSL
jgi:glycosyltransferase involved in cell wall biosynthesis